VIHEGECLAFGFEPRHELARVHSRFDELQRNPAMHWMPLLGQPDFAHAALANLLEQMIRTDSPRGRRAGIQMSTFRVEVRR
jgi:hypothetical protein